MTNPVLMRSDRAVWSLLHDWWPWRPIRFQPSMNCGRRCARKENAPSRSGYRLGAPMLRTRGSGDRGVRNNSVPKIQQRTYRDPVTFLQMERGVHRQVGGGVPGGDPKAASLGPNGQRKNPGLPRQPGLSRRSSLESERLAATEGRRRLETVVAPPS